jgi:hypothetical protein
MLHGQRVIAVTPAYRAERRLAVSPRIHSRAPEWKLTPTSQAA